MIRVMVAGLGTMGRSHALAYHRNPAFDLVGLVNRSTPKLDPELAGYAIEPDFHAALHRLKPAAIRFCMPMMMEKISPVPTSSSKSGWTCSPSWCVSPR